MLRQHRRRLWRQWNALISSHVTGMNCILWNPTSEYNFSWRDLNARVTASKCLSLINSAILKRQRSFFVIRRLCKFVCYHADELTVIASEPPEGTAFVIQSSCFRALPLVLYCRSMLNVSFVREMKRVGLRPKNCVRLLAFGAAIVNSGVRSSVFRVPIGQRFDFTYHVITLTQSSQLLYLILLYFILISQERVLAKYTIICVARLIFFIIDFV